MIRGQRPLIAIAIAVVGLCMMGLAHDRPQWYFGAIGIVGFLSILGAFGWSYVSAASERADGEVDREAKQRGEDGKR
jgi:hypothetical protein